MLVKLQFGDKCPTVMLVCPFTVMLHISGYGHNFVNWTWVENFRSPTSVMGFGRDRLSSMVGLKYKGFAWS